jgi:hypothetical protein
LLTAVLFVCWATPSAAITSEQKVKVRALVKEGGELIDSGQFAQARDRLMAALDLARVPAIALYAARAHASLFELTKAAQLYRLAIEMPLDEALWDNDITKTQFQLRSREAAKAELQQVLERNCTVKIRLVGVATGEVHVTLDGIGLDEKSLADEQPLSPGSHVIAIVQGAMRRSQVVFLERAEHKSVTFELTPVQVDEPTNTSSSGTLSKPSRAQQVSKTESPHGNTEPTQQYASASTYATRDYLTWTAYGMGALGIGTGIFAGVITLGKRSELIRQGCSSEGSCPRNSQVDSSDVESYNAWRTVAKVGFIIGGVGAVTGLALTLTKPKTEHTSQLTLRMSPVEFSLLGTF